MTDKADGSLVLAQLQVAFVWECDKDVPVPVLLNIIGLDIQ